MSDVSFQVTLDEGALRKLRELEVDVDAAVMDLDNFREGNWDEEDGEETEEELKLKLETKYDDANQRFMNHGVLVALTVVDYWMTRERS